MTNLRNWAGNYAYRAARVHRPESVEQICELVAGSHNVKALGTRHSFNEIADTDGDLISVEGLNRVESIDSAGSRVTVQAGTTYAQLCSHLHREGYAIHNLASLPHISVAGACATATHGSGDRNGNLATAVIAIQVVDADGSLRDLSREQNRTQFEGAVVGLGALGVVTRLTLEIAPSFEMRQEVFEGLPLASLSDNFDEVTSSAYSVSLFTDWRTPIFNQVWLKRRKGSSETSFFGATRASRPLHPIGTMPAVNCTEQMGVPGPWHERLPHFRAEFTPSSGEELQTEYLLPRRHAFAALSTISELGSRIAPLLQISEVRTVAADHLWMSPCYQEDCVGIHFTWVKNWDAVLELLPRIEERLAPFQARPHWGKLFTMPPERVGSLYPRLPDFRELVQGFDPQGKFRNGFLNRYVVGEGA